MSLTPAQQQKVVDEALSVAQQFLVICESAGMHDQIQAARKRAEKTLLASEGVEAPAAATSSGT